MTQANHTPLPTMPLSVKQHIAQDEPKIVHVYEIQDAEGEVIGCSEDHNDAAFIVRACNSHYELLAALEKAIPFVQLAADNAHFDWVKHCAQENASERSINARREHAQDQQLIVDQLKAAIAKAEGGAK